MTSFRSPSRSDRRFNAHAAAQALTGLALLSVVMTACGDASCPNGSIAVNDRCEPAPMCRKGEVQDGGACIDPNDLTADAGPDGGGSGATGGSSGTGGTSGIGGTGGTGGAGGTSGGAGGAGGTGGSSGQGGTGGDDDMDSGVDAGRDAEVDTRCDALDCGAYGTCEIADDAARCACHSGHAGELCDACDEGLELQGTECVVVPCDDEGAPNCGEHGECSAATGEPICVCEHPFAGAACNDCAAGFAKQPDGTCEPDCGTCSAHSVCNETLMTPTCECVAGYARSGSSCEWSGDGTTGGIVDGELDDAGEWTAQHINFDAGTATFVNPTINGQCELGRLEQDFVMPARGQAEPLVLELVARTSQSVRYLVELGDSVTRLEIPGNGTDALNTGTVCLGDAGYGGNVHLAITPALHPPVTTSCASLLSTTLDSVRIRVAGAGECPAPATVLGNLSSATGWQLSGATVASGELSLGEAATASTAFEVPNAAVGAALKFTSAAPFLTAEIDGLSFGQRRAPTSVVLCIPSWAYGSAHSIRFSTPSGSAADISNLRFESDARCGSGEFDGSFEGTVDVGSWSDTYLGSSFTTSTARTGAKSWENFPGASYLGTIVRFPRLTSPSERPAISFFHRVSGTNMESSVSVSPWAASAFKATTTIWRSQTLCLGREWQGQLASMRLLGSARMTGGAAGTAGAYVDDISTVVRLAASCP